MTRNTDTSEAEPLPLRKRALFSFLITAILTIASIAILELALRFAGFGHSPDFYRIEKDDSGKEWIRENRWFTAPYFSESLARQPFPFRIPKEKPPNAYRIFVLGSSAAMGDPEASFSIARILNAMLSESYPDIEFEVINAAITAINSHVVTKIARDCSELAPDLFIVYEGHNEVIGPYGPAAVLTPFLNSPTTITIRSAINRSRTGQLFSRLSQLISLENPDMPEWGGMEMFLEQTFAKGSPELEKVRHHFSRNLKSITDSARNASADTLLCTVVSNLRDFAPFQSDHDSALSQSQSERWYREVQLGDQYLAKGEKENAEQHYLAAYEIDDQPAELAFRLGRIQLAMNNTEHANYYLKRALDLDTLRFRTDSVLNGAIRTVGRESDDKTSELVDLERLSAEKSPFGIVGDNWLYEHVHLNFQGTYEIANELFRYTTSRLLEAGRIDENGDQSIPIEEMRIRMAYTTYEQAMIISTLLDRFSKPPFTSQMDNRIRQQMWSQRQAVTDRILNDPDAQVRIIANYQRAASTNPNDWVIARNYGMALVAFKRHQAAIEWLEKANSVIDDDPDTLFALAVAYQLAGWNERAEETRQRLTAIQPHYPGLKQNKS